MADQPNVVVVGTGAATGVPDQCVLLVALNATAHTPSEALELCTEAADNVIPALGQEGVERSDIRTTNLSIQDFHDRETMRVTARIGSYQLEVTIRSLDDVGRVVARLSAEAGDSLQIHHLQLGLSDSVPLEKEARRLAVLNAQLKASELAEVAGVTLGEIMSIEDEGGWNPRSQVARVTAASASLPVAAGKITVSSSVVITYAIDN